jgi:nitrogen regulatory protein PII
MKMIWVILRPATLRPVITALRDAGIHGMVLVNTSDECRQPCFHPQRQVPEDQQTGMLMMVLADRFIARAVAAIRTSVKAHAGQGTAGSEKTRMTSDGKILVTSVDDYYQIRPARGPAGIPMNEESNCDF